jgi:hypothetical protein
MEVLTFYGRVLDEHAPDDWLTVEVAPAYPDDPAPAAA